MKRNWPAVAILLVAAALASASFLVTHRTYCAREPDYAEWFQKEFHVTQAQAKAIAALEDAYEPVCRGHCKRIAQAEAALLETEKTKGRSSADYAAARERWRALCDECYSATKKQVESIAALMSPDEGKRYLTLVIPKLRHGAMDAACDPK